MRMRVLSVIIWTIQVRYLNSLSGCSLETDTGFFSVEVLERAVGALGFTFVITIISYLCMADICSRLIRWRSEMLRSQQEHPQYVILMHLLSYRTHQDLLVVRWLLFSTTKNTGLQCVDLAILATQRMDTGLI